MTHFACWSPDNKHWKALLCTNITSQIHLQDSGAQDSYRLSFPSHSLISVHRLKDFSLGLLSVCLSFMPKVVLSRSSTQAWLYRFQLDCLDPRISQNDQYLKPGFTSPFVNKPCPSNEFLDLPPIALHLKWHDFTVGFNLELSAYLCTCFPTILPPFPGELKLQENRSNMYF